MNPIRFWCYDGCKPCNWFRYTTNWSQLICGIILNGYSSDEDRTESNAVDRLLPCCITSDHIYSADQSGTFIRRFRISSRKIIKRSVVVLLAGVLLLVYLDARRNKKKDEVQRYAWPLGTSSPEDTVTQLYAEKFAKEVSRLSHGNMEDEVYPNSTFREAVSFLRVVKMGIFHL